MADRTTRVAGSVAIVALVIVGIVTGDQQPAVAVAAALVAIAVTTWLTVRPATGWAMLAGTAVITAAVTVIVWGATSSLGWFALIVVVGWCALRAGVVQTVLLTGGVVTVFALQWLLQSDDPGWGAWIGGTVFAAIVCAFAQRQRDLLERLRAAQAELAENARLEERTRIAREIHDVVGHALTVSLLHVTSARLALDDDPEEARASLAEAERLGRRSLTEVRQSIGGLRDRGPGLLRPMPGAAELEELATSFRSAGTPVELQVRGDLAALPATSGLTVYRILQAALTNIARHAPGSPAEVHVTVTDDDVHLSVSNPVTGPRPHQWEPGAGIHGMRERAASLGGTLAAGPSSSGWRVEAALPNTLTPPVEPIA